MLMPSNFDAIRLMRDEMTQANARHSQNAQNAYAIANNLRNQGLQWEEADALANYKNKVRDFDDIGMPILIDSRRASEDRLELARRNLARAGVAGGMEDIREEDKRRDLQRIEAIKASDALKKESILRAGKTLMDDPVQIHQTFSVAQQRATDFARQNLDAIANGDEEAINTYNNLRESAEMAKQNIDKQKKEQLNAVEYLKSQDLSNFGDIQQQLDLFKDAKESTKDAGAGLNLPLLKGTVSAYVSTLEPNDVQKDHLLEQAGIDKKRGDHVSFFNRKLKEQIDRNKRNYSQMTKEEQDAFDNKQRAIDAANKQALFAQTYANALRGNQEAIAKLSTEAADLKTSLEKASEANTTAQKASWLKANKEKLQLEPDASIGGIKPEQFFEMLTGKKSYSNTEKLDINTMFEQSVIKMKNRGSNLMKINGVNYGG